MSSQQELQALQLPFRDPSSHSPFRVLFIGRLDSYKRVDWLLQALSCLHLPWELVIVGDGPRRSYFHQLSLQLFGSDSNHLVCFKGRLSEKNKLDQLAIADILVLPSDKSNEAFGIVQLEAMAAGIPSLAFQCPRSGMAWVAQLPDLDWSQTPNGLVDVLYRLASDRPLCSHLGLQARSRYLELFSRDIWLRQLTFWY
ncbi:glycosyltransferase [Synechococcus sp. GEYO]|uniref:glycosyltransferase n=1 Tax=Synechococcus sp. GEYO TaxID=2575511 RepID=UPI001FCC01E1|nr:glycosyltransferase [Synechococcus sp. GEYO]